MSLQLFIGRISEWTRIVLWILLLVTMLGSCQTAFRGYPERPTPLTDDLAELKSSISAGKIKRCLGVIDPPNDEAGQTSDSGAIPLVATGGAEGGLDELSCRNQLVAARMYAIDLRFSEFEESLFRETRQSGFAATLATLGLTTTAAFAGGGASQVLSGIAAFIIGGREAFQKEVLAERTVIAIHTAMRANRARVGVRIREGLQRPIICSRADGADCVAYPLASALSDLNHYYDAGTILGALVGITEAVGTQANVQSERLDRVTRGLDPDIGAPTRGSDVIQGRADRAEIEGAETPPEEALLSSDLQSIQGFLCTDVDGIIGSNTRAAIRIWQQVSEYEITGRLETSTQAGRLVYESSVGGQCNTAIYRNIHERLRLANQTNFEEFRDALAQLDAKNPRLQMNVPATATSLSELRDAIGVAGRLLNVDTSQGVTADFEDELYDALDEG